MTWSSTPKTPGRAEPAYLFEMLEAAIDAGATVVNIPDTTGYAVPEQYGALIRGVARERPNIERATISVHCHDDLGMAVANSLAGIRERRPPGGRHHQRNRRAGRATRRWKKSSWPSARARLLRRGHAASTRASSTAPAAWWPTCSACRFPPNKAVVGGNAFSHSSGIHVDGFLKDRETYEIMRPEDVGLRESRVVLTARTGRAGLRDRLEKLGFTLSKEELDQTYQRFLAVADKKQEVFDEDLMAIVHDELHPVARSLRTWNTCTSTAARRRFRPPPCGCA